MFSLVYILTSAPNYYVMNIIMQVLCLGSLVHPDIRFDKPPPDKPFQADLCGKSCDKHMIYIPAYLLSYDFIAIRHPVDRDFPFRFDQFVQKKVQSRSNSNYAHAEYVKHVIIQLL